MNSPEKNLRAGVALSTSLLVFPAVESTTEFSEASFLNSDAIDSVQAATCLNVKDLICEVGPNWRIEIKELAIALNNCDPLVLKTLRLQQLGDQLLSITSSSIAPLPPIEKDTNSTATGNRRLEHRREVLRAEMLAVRTISPEEFKRQVIEHTIGLIDIYDKAAPLVLADSVSVHPELFSLVSPLTYFRESGGLVRIDFPNM